MPKFDKITLGRQARELGFVRDTFEKIKSHLKNHDF